MVHSLSPKDQEEQARKISPFRQINNLIVKHECFLTVRMKPSIAIVSNLDEPKEYDELKVNS